MEIERLMGEEIGCDVSFKDKVVRNRDDARKLAAELREKWSLGLGPIANPINVLEAHGVKVIEVDRKRNRISLSIKHA